MKILHAKKHVKLGRMFLLWYHSYRGKSSQLYSRESATFEEKLWIANLSFEFLRILIVPILLHRRLAQAISLKWSDMLITCDPFRLAAESCVSNGGK